MLYDIARWKEEVKWRKKGSHSGKGGPFETKVHVIGVLGHERN